MASGVAAVWVPVSDMQRAIGFYRDALGLTVTSESDDWSEIDAGGLRLGLNAREPASPSSGGGAVITFQPDGSLEDEVDDLRSKRVEVPGDISEHPWGRIVPFTDSEGNDLQLYAPPQG
ncbi:MULTISPECIES: VOC family protein [Curtobacterium]|uniref:VOC family protein n=1 Tax=Curtobacterium flaccumfaciens TaxID=2035 RepID=UPI003EE70E78